MACPWRQCDHQLNLDIHGDEYGFDRYLTTGWCCDHWSWRGQDDRQHPGRLHCVPNQCYDQRPKSVLLPGIWPAALGRARLCRYGPLLLKSAIPASNINQQTGTPPFSPTATTQPTTSKSTTPTAQTKKTSSTPPKKSATSKATSTSKCSTTTSSTKPATTPTPPPT